MNGISKTFETNSKEILMASNKKDENELKNKRYLSLCSKILFYIWIW